LLVAKDDGAVKWIDGQIMMLVTPSTGTSITGGAIVGVTAPVKIDRDGTGPLLGQSAVIGV
jgi:hypothetical protein